jgi:hypothetical protein
MNYHAMSYYLYIIDHYTILTTHLECQPSAYGLHNGWRAPFLPLLNVADVLVPLLRHPGHRAPSALVRHRIVEQLPLGDQQPGSPYAAHELVRGDEHRILEAKLSNGPAIAMVKVIKSLGICFIPILRYKYDIHWIYNSKGKSNSKRI